MGTGSYGKCYSSYDRFLHQHVVVKRQALKDNALLVRELLFFRTMRAFPHDNVVKMLDHFTASKDASAGWASTPWFYIVFEACSIDL